MENNVIELTVVESEKSDKKQVNAGQGQGAFFPGKRAKNNEVAGKCCKGGGCSKTTI